MEDCRILPADFDAARAAEATAWLLVRAGRPVEIAMALDVLADADRAALARRGRAVTGAPTDTLETLMHGACVHPCPEWDALVRPLGQRHVMLAGTASVSKPEADDRAYIDRAWRRSLRQAQGMSRSAA